MRRNRDCARATRSVGGVRRAGSAIHARCGRGHHRDAGGDHAPVEGDSRGAREIFLPALQEGLAAAAAFRSDAAGLGWSQPAGDDATDSSSR